MTGRSMGSSIEAGGAGSTEREPNEDGLGVDPEIFKDALARWTTGVCVVALREEDGRVLGTTVGSFASVSAEPPLVMFSLGAGAQVLPFLEEDVRFVVNVLSTEQKRLASVFADAFPVGPSPFPDEGPPVIAGSHAVLTCRAKEVVRAGASRIVISLVEAATTNPDRSPLLYYMRGYRRLAEED